MLFAHLSLRSTSSKQRLLRLLSSSHKQQQAAAAAARAACSNGDGPGLHSSYATDAGGQSAGSDLVAGAAADGDLMGYDAAAASSPLRVHQLIGDPRTGVADDTTTAPFTNDLQVEHLWSSGTGGKLWGKRVGQPEDSVIDWFRYSAAGNHLPHMYMDARLSDHSRNLMYLLRCKDPDTWTIPRLARKFRIRRQRVMAILAQKEIQAHRMRAGSSMAPPVHPFVFNVPLADFKLDPASKQPLDLTDLLTQQQQQQHAAPAAAAAAAAALSSPLPDAEGLGTISDFLAQEEGATGASQEGAAAAAAAGGSSSSSPSLSLSSSDQQADLAVLMPQVALTAQQLQLALLQLLQTHHYSIPELGRRLLQQVDVAEAYYKAHVQGTPLEQVLLQQATGAQQQQPAADEGATEQQEGAEPGTSAAKPVQLDFDLQRQAVQQLLSKLEPLLAAAGPQRERETGRLLAQLQAALDPQQQQAPPAGSSEAGGEQQQQPGLGELVAAADPVLLAAAFNKLSVGQRQQLLEAVPDARITLNIQGTDLRAALSADSSSSSREDAASTANDSSSSSAAVEWPGQVPSLVDVWGFEEVPRQQLAALQQELPAVQGLLQEVAQLAALSGSSSSSALSSGDISAVQQAVQVYEGLLRLYEAALVQQTVAATLPEDVADKPPQVQARLVAAASRLPASSQRRMFRLLREVDPDALDKLLVWETLLKLKAQAEGGLRRGEARANNRMQERMRQRLRALDEQAVAAGRTPPSQEYPALPANTPRQARQDRDMWAAWVEAEVVGRQFHRGSGDSHFVTVPTYPKFEGLTLEAFDKITESEISIINRLAAERQDNVMWREFRTRLLRNMGLLGPGLAQHSGVVKPPKPAAGWSWVVHPVGGTAKAQSRRELREQAELQWQDEDSPLHADSLSWWQAAHLQGKQPVQDPARGPSPAFPYVAEPGGTFRALSEEEALVVADTKPKPRARWFAGGK